MFLWIEEVLDREKIGDIYMNYELAKQLDEAGLRVPEKAQGTYNNGIYCPTFEELIDAVGGKNLALTADREGNWRVYSYLYAEEGRGSTPSEAVARLWLALN
jgi:hypothetical protein